MKTTTCFLASFILFGAALHPWARAGEPSAAPDNQTKGLTFPISYTGEVLGNLSGGYRQGAIYDGVLNVGMQGDLEKLAGWKGGSFLVSGLYPHGSSLTEKYVQDLNGVSNIDAYDSIRLYEAWFQQEFDDGKFSLRVGQLLADTEFFVSDNAALFLNGAFGAIPLLSQNFSSPVYPVAAPGVRAAWKPSETVSVQAGIYDGNAGDPVEDNRHGLDWSFNGNKGALALAEIALKPWKDGGVYKVGAFYHSPTDNDVFPESGYHGRAGGYFIADQPLWLKPGTEGEGLSGFLRIGGAPANRCAVPFYFDTGLSYKGLIPGRSRDVAGLGFSYTHLSADLLDENGGPIERHHEAIVEATYRVAVTNWLTVQPDVQYIFNPGGAAKADNALVAGVRFTLTF